MDCGQGAHQRNCDLEPCFCICHLHEPGDDAWQQLVPMPPLQDRVVQYLKNLNGES